eukprot:15431542-Alexandrium_andersonii.AAC.1
MDLSSESTPSEHAGKKRRVSSSKASAALARMVDDYVRDGFAERLQKIQRTLQEHPDWVPTIEAVLRSKEKGGNTNALREELPRGVIYVGNVPFYVLKRVLCRLSGLGEEVWENLDNPGEVCKRVFICATGGEPNLKLPARQMQIEDFTKWSLSRHQFCGAQLQDLEPFERFVDWEFLIGIYRLVEKDGLVTQ